MHKKADSTGTSASYRPRFEEKMKQNRVLLVCRSPRMPIWTKRSISALVLFSVSSFVVAGPPAGESAGAASAGSWSKVSGPSRFSHTATLLSDGRLLVAGGCPQPYALQCPKTAKSAQIFDPSSQKWSSTGSMKVPRVRHVATLLHNGKVLVVGGDCLGRLGTECVIKPSSSEIYDPATRRWSPAGTMAVVHEESMITLLPKGPAATCGDNCGKVLVTGCGSCFPAAVAPNAELFDPASGKWSVAAPTHHHRNGHTATLLHNGNVLVAGGTGLDFNAFSELYHPESNTWTPTGNRLASRRGHTATLLRNGKVIVVGGNPIPLNAAGSELYDPEGAPDPAHPELKTGGVWTPGPAPSKPRSGHGAALLKDGRLLILGGSELAGTPVNSAELYDPRTNKWSPAGTMAPGAGNLRSSFTATTLKDGRVLVIGRPLVTKAGRRDPGRQAGYVDRGPDLDQRGSVEIFTPAGLTSPANTDPGQGVDPKWWLAAGIVAGASIVLIALAKRRRKQP